MTLKGAGKIILVTIVGLGISTNAAAAESSRTAYSSIQPVEALPRARQSLRRKHSFSRNSLDGYLYGTLYARKIREGQNWNCYLEDGLAEDLVYQVQAFGRRVRVIIGEKVYNGRRRRRGFHVRTKGKHEGTVRTYKLSTTRVRPDGATLRWEEILRDSTGGLGCKWTWMGEFNRSPL